MPEKKSGPDMIRQNIVEMAKKSTEIFFETLLKDKKGEYKDFVSKDELIEEVLENIFGGKVTPPESATHLVEIVSKAKINGLMKEIRIIYDFDIAKDSAGFVYFDTMKEDNSKN